MENVEVSVWDAQATFELKPGREFRPDAIRKVIADAGFTPRDIFIAVKGELKQTKDQFVFQPSGWTQEFFILENEVSKKLVGRSLKHVGLIARVVGETSPYRLEIEKVE